MGTEGAEGTSCWTPFVGTHASTVSVWVAHITNFIDLYYNVKQKRTETCLHKKISKGNLADAGMA